MISEEGRSGYDIPRETVRMVVVKVDGELYDSDGRIETEDSIKRILVEADLEEYIEELQKQTDVKLNPKL